MTSRLLELLTIDPLIAGSVVESPESVVYLCLSASFVLVFECAFERGDFLVIFHEWVIQLTFEFECAFSYYALEPHVNDENMNLMSM